MRTVVVTGHSKGIGLAITNALLQQENCVVGVSRSSIEPHKKLHQISIDLSDLHAITKLAKQLGATENPFNNSEATTLLPLVDAIICNAGQGQFGALENFSAEQIEQSLRLNLISPLSLVRTLIPSLKAQPRSDIVFIGSESGRQAGRFGSVYSAAKFGLRGAAQSLRAECAGNNCHVGIVNPGMVRTSFFDDLSFEPGSAEQHALNADQIADAVMSLLNSADNAVIEEINVRPLQHVVQKKPK